jgi:hypothetical protein
MGGESLEIRSDILEKVTSAEAADVTPQLSRIYLQLVNAPARFWERENVLRFTDRADDTQTVTTAWAQLAAHVKAPPEVIRKALEWLHNQEVVTYSVLRNDCEIVLSFEGLSNPGRGR